jgi:hypothetical protein
VVLPITKEPRVPAVAVILPIDKTPAVVQLTVLPIVPEPSALKTI